MAKSVRAPRPDAASASLPWRAPVRSRRAAFRSDALWRRGGECRTLATGAVGGERDGEKALRSFLFHIACAQQAKHTCATCDRMAARRIVDSLARHRWRISGCACARALASVSRSIRRYQGVVAWAPRGRGWVKEPN